MAELSPHMSAEQLKEQLVIRVFETNLIVRTLDMYGVRVDVDLVERLMPGHDQRTYTEIMARPAEEPEGEEGL